MQTIENVPVEIDFKRLVRALGGQRMIPRIQTEAQWAIETAKQLARPKAILDVFSIKRLGASCVVVTSDAHPEPVMLEVGNRGVELLANAECVQISFVTLGDQLQNYAGELNRNGEMLKQYILDTALVLALYHLGQTVNAIAEKTAAQKGWGVSRRLSPGDLRGWALDGQLALGKLLPVEKIGMQIRAGGLLSPLKSASGLIGLGPAYTEDRVGTVCQWCRSRKTCPIILSGISQTCEAGTKPEAKGP